MSDQLTLDRIQKLHLSIRQEAIDIYEDICEAMPKNVLCRFSHTYRSNEEQDALYLKRPKVTNAKGGQSFHNYGLAVDIVFLIDTDGNGTYETASWNTKKDFDGDGSSEWMEVVKIFKSYGWECGIDWKFIDAPHFQKTGGKTIKQLQTLTGNKGGIAWV